jgi:glutathione peroxidase
MRAPFTKLASLLFIALLPTMIWAAPEPTGSAYDFTFDGIDGNPLPLAAWKGKAMLVTNTASFCGYTKQYAGLQQLWEKYESKGLVVVGVPSNDFGGQEPESEVKIKEFCRGAFGITFPLTAKTVVRGAGAHPFYQWAKSVLGEKAAPAWNFHKYLVGRDGELRAAFPAQVPPDHPDLIAAIERELASGAPATSASGS